VEGGIQGVGFAGEELVIFGGLLIVFEGLGFGMEWNGWAWVMGHMFGVFCDGWNGGQKGMGYSFLSPDGVVGPKTRACDGVRAS
jgi:hypothetical protein